MQLQSKRPLLLILSLLLATAAQAASLSESCKLLIASGNPEYPPYLWRDPDDENRLIGANVELMGMLSREIGIPIDVKYVGPWGRVQEEMKFGRIDLIAGAFHTLPRLEYMDYVYPTIANTRSVVITPANSKLRYRKWSDLSAYSGLTVINNSFGEAFDRYAEKNLKIEKTATLESAIKMLNLNRADYVIYEDAPARAFAAKLNIKGLQEAPIPISNEDLHLTISHRSACNSGALRGKIAQAMNRFAKEKVMEGLLNQAIQAWRNQKK